MTTIHNHLLPLKLWTAEDSNIMTKLKLKRLKKNATPTEMRQNLGPRLADAVFSNICPVTRNIFGLGQELKGPGDELWSQPHRQLMGEIVLEQFPSRRHRQALTHQSILDYGEKCMTEWEEKVKARMEAEMKERLRDLEEELTELTDVRVEQARAREREDFLVRIALMEERLEARHRREMEALERKMTEERDAQVAQVMQTMNSSHQHETDNLLEASKTLLTNRFHFKVNWIRADLEEDYNNKLKSETKIIEMKLKKKSDSNKCADIQEMKNQMLQNVVCTACLTADFLLKEFQYKIEIIKKELTSTVECNSRLVKEIEELEARSEACSLETRAWECVVGDLVHQFHKFIEFQLKLPQGEKTHLISWDKMVDRKNHLLSKMLERLKPGNVESEPQVCGTVPLQSTSSIFDSAICDNKDVLSIISSIIRRVIPSMPDLDEAQREVDGIIESIIKQVIPSTSSVGEEKGSAYDVARERSRQLCARFLRAEHPLGAGGAAPQAVPPHLHQRNTQDKAASFDQQLKDRISEITKIMELHPNILKYIQGP